MIALSTVSTPLTTSSVPPYTVPAMDSHVMGYSVALYGAYVLSEIVIPPAVKWISEDAVRYKYRRSVTFEGNTEIIRQEDDDRFNYSYDLVIIAKKGSPAEEYAVQNHFRFQELLSPE
jgi:hypothetical protein